MVTEYWASSDLHLGHSNIIKSCRRPYDSREEHDRDIIEKFQVIKKSDHLYLLGDLCWSHNYHLLKEIPGQKHIMLGNHDDEKELIKIAAEANIQEIKQVKILKIDKQQIWLSHYPHISWKNSFHGSFHLHGHMHGTLDEYNENSDALRLDVGVDSWNFEPVNYEQVKEYFKGKALRNAML